MAAEAKASEIQELNHLISWGECYCLNEHPQHPLQNIKVGDQRIVLSSDADEELLLHIAFMEPVRLHSINVCGPTFEKRRSAPREVDIFVNKENLGFEDAEDLEPAQSLELTPDDLEETSVTALNFVKFQRVNNVSFMVKVEDVRHTPMEEAERVVGR